MSNLPGQGDTGIPENFDMGSLESPAQRILRDEFEQTTVLNAAALADFDPNQTTANTVIELNTAFPEAEDGEPQLAKLMREKMLRELGLDFHMAPSHDPGTMLQYTYRDGEVDQIRLVERPDGVRVPVLTHLASDNDGNAVERVRLLSHELAAERVARHQDNLDEQKVDLRLMKEFDLDEEFLEAAGISLEDKIAMLAAFDEIGDLDVAKPDLKALEKVRQDLVKTMLPGSQFLQTLREDKIHGATMAYGEGIVGFFEKHGVDKRSAKEILESEQLLRLTALNKQLRIRRRVATLGNTAMTAAAMVSGAMGGALIGVSVLNDYEPVAEAVVGAGLGLLAGIQKTYQLRKNSRAVENFSHLEKLDADRTLDDQLAGEYQLAQSYSLYYLNIFS